MGDVVGAVTGAVAVLATAAKIGGRSQWTRTRILQDLEITSKMPKTSSARNELLEHVDRTVSQMVQRESDRVVRNYLGAAWDGLVFGIAAAALTQWLTTAGTDQTFGVSLSAGVVAMIVSLTIRLRELRTRSSTKPAESASKAPDSSLG